MLEAPLARNGAMAAAMAAPGASMQMAKSSDYVLQILQPLMYHGIIMESSWNHHGIMDHCSHLFTNSRPSVS